MGILKKKETNKDKRNFKINPDRKVVAGERKQFKKATQKHRRRVRAHSDINQEVVDHNKQLGEEAKLTQKLFWLLTFDVKSFLISFKC